MKALTKERQKHTNKQANRQKKYTQNKQTTAKNMKRKTKEKNNPTTP